MVSLLLAGLSQLSQGSTTVQSNAWQRGQIGIRWVLQVQDLDAVCNHDLLAMVNNPSTELLLTANSCGVVTLDPGTATRMWDHKFENGSGNRPLLQGQQLYFPEIAFDVLTGRPLWQRAATGSWDLTVTDKTLYVLDYNQLRAINPENGSSLWQAAITDAGEMLATEKALFLVGRTGTSAINSIDGELLWHSAIANGRDLKGQSYCRPPVVIGHTLMVTESCGRIRGLDVQAGELLWQRSQVLIQNFGAGMVYMVDDLGQMTALQAATGQINWVYPTTDAAGTFDNPALTISETETLVADRTLYTVDLEGRIVALETASGRPRWVSEPLIPMNVGVKITLHQIGQLVIAASDTKASAPLIGLDINTGTRVWQSAHFSGRLVAVMNDDILLIQRLGPEPERLLYLVQAETGQLLGQLTVADFIDPTQLIKNEPDFVYIKQGSFIYAIGPAAAAEATAMAQTFLTRGDYRSAVRTLGALKLSDEQGYLIAGGEAVAAEALKTWMDELQPLVENETMASWPLDLRNEVEQLGIPAAQTRLSGSKEPPLLPSLMTGRATWLGWCYIPFILPMVVFLVSMGLNRKQENIYRAGMTAGLTCWGGLVYLLSRFVRGEPNSLYQFLIPFSFDVTLMGGVPLAVWWLTRSKGYTLLALVVSVAHRYLLYTILAI
ncbi:MAG: PQQ-binding-like beta-propeller repeat protein [Chloroflexota bacterium]